MVAEDRLEKLRALGLLGGEDDDIRSIVERHDILLGKLAADPIIGGILFGMESADIGVVLLARSSTNLVLTLSVQSIVGDGDNSKVRILLPSIGDWFVTASVGFHRGSADPSNLIGELFLDDSGTAEKGVARARFSASQERVTGSQSWKVTVTSVDTPVELKARMTGAGGDGQALADDTLVIAIRSR